MKTDVQIPNSFIYKTRPTRHWSLFLLLLVLCSAGQLSADVVMATKVVDTTDSMPGTTTGEKFTRFTGIARYDGKTAFIGQGRANGAKDTRQGVYLSDGAMLTTVADSTTTVPGTAQPFLVGQFTSATTTGGRVGFLGVGGGRRGVYTGNGGALSKVADTSDTIPGRTSNFSSFSSPSINGNGKVAFIGTGPFVNSVEVFQGVYTDIAGPLLPLAQSGSTIPGGGTFAEFGTVSIYGNAIAFSGSNSGVSASRTKVGVYDSRTGAVMAAANQANFIPSAGTKQFDYFFLPILCRGRLAFAGGANSTTDGIYTDLPGGLRRVIDYKSTLPDVPVRFRGKFQLPIALSGLFSFTDGLFAFMAGPDANSYRIYTLAGGVPLRLVGPGDTIGGKTVSSVFLYKESLGNSQDLAFYASFTDGSQGIYLMGIPKQVNVCVDFAGSGITANADRATFIAQAQRYFTDAGFGPNNTNRVIFYNASAVPAPPQCDPTGPYRNITATFISVTNRYWGTSDKRLGRAYVNTKLFGERYGGDPNPAARRRVGMAETLAHEVGHTLCAVHDCRNGGGAKRVGEDLVACPGPANSASLMTVGTCVAEANRANAPGAAGARAFSAASTMQLRSGVMNIDSCRPDWNLVAAFETDVIKVVQGQCAPSTSSSSEEFDPEDPIVDFSYQVMSGDESMFQFGWINQNNQFVPPLDPASNPDSLLEVSGGTQIQFALLGLPGSPFDGQVFPQKSYGLLGFNGTSFSPSQAATPCATNYYSQSTIDFMVGGNLFSVLVDAGEWSCNSGFYQTTMADLVGEVGNLVDVVRYGFRLNRDTGRFVETVTVHNVSQVAIPAPISLVLDGLSPNATLYQPDGVTACLPPSGSPYKNGPGAENLMPGDTYTFELEFTNPTQTGIAYDLRVAAGPASR